MASVALAVKPEPETVRAWPAVSPVVVGVTVMDGVAADAAFTP
jgi:hypothetical protein